MEYEILEAAFVKAGEELQEKRADLAEVTRRAESLEAQAELDREERKALLAKVASFEALGAVREADARERAARELNASAVLAERDAALKCAREELHLEADILAAVRRQIEAAETERAATLAQVTALQQRLAAAGLLSADELSTLASPHQELPVSASWEAVLQERTRALEHGLQARDEELAALRSALDASRAEAARLREDNPATLARQMAHETESRLKDELAASQARYEALEAQSAAGLAAADLARTRLDEQTRWLERKRSQLESARREADALRDELHAARNPPLAARSAHEGNADDDNDEGYSGGCDGDDGLGVENSLGSSMMGGDKQMTTEWGGRVRSLTEQVASLQEQLKESLAASTARLAAEAAETEKLRGAMQAKEAALGASLQENRDLTTALRDEKTRAATLGGEARTRALEVQRLSAELGAMRSRLQATSQEARAADSLASTVLEQRAITESELSRLRDGASLRDDLANQLRAALAVESERVAKAWEERERMNASRQARDDALQAARAELGSVKEALSTARDEVQHLREQSRLSEILLRGAEERTTLKQRAMEAAKSESAELHAEVASLRSRLAALTEVELVAKSKALEEGVAALEAEKLSTEHRQERVVMLSEELGRRTAEVEALKAVAISREEQLRTLREGEIRRLEEARDTALAESHSLKLQHEAARESIARLQQRLASKGDEVVARGEQLRIAHESTLVLTLEASLKDERLRSVEEALEVERTRHQREVGVLSQLRKESEAAHAAVVDLSRQLARERERGAQLELKLGQRDEQMSSLVDSLRSAEARGEGRDARLAILRAKASVASEERHTFDVKLGALSSRLAAHEAELSHEKENARLLVAEVTQAQAQAEAHRSEAAGLRTAVFELEGRLVAKEEQLATLNGRLQTARADLDVHIALIQEEVKATQLKLDAKDIALELQMEEAVSREEQAHGFMAEVGTRLRRAHSAMAAKDDLLSDLERRLRDAADALTTADEERSSLRQETTKERRAKETAMQQLTTLSERHSMMASDFAIASEALDSYRDTLVSAEVRMAADRDKVTALQRELRDLQAQLFKESTPSATGDAPPAVPLPPLSSAAGSSEVGASRVHYLYFLSSFLLLKTALAAQGQVANIGAQDVFEEIVRNEVPLDEWPTYIFTRVFAHRGHTADSKRAVGGSMAASVGEMRKETGPSFPPPAAELLSALQDER